MAVRVPSKRPHTILMADAEPDKGIGQAASARGCLLIAVAPEPSLGEPAHNLVFAIHRLGMPQNRGHKERHVHNFGLHGRPPVFAEILILNSTPNYARF